MHLMIDGLDYYDIPHVTTKWTTGSVASFGAGRFGGGQSAHLSSAGGNLLTKTFPTNHNFIVGVARRELAFANDLIRMENGASPGNPVGAIAHIGDGRLFWRTGAFQDQLARLVPSVVLSSNIWYYHELKVATTFVAGVLTLNMEYHLDGFLVGTRSESITTTIGGFNEVTIGAANNDVDDIYIYDDTDVVNNAFEGVVKIGTIYPRLDSGDHFDWVPSAAGAHFNKVNEHPVPDDDTTYVSSNVVAAKDSYFFDPTSESNIRALQLNMMCRKDDAGEHHVNSIWRDSVPAENIGTDDFVTVSSYIQHIKAYGKNDPLTAAQWTSTRINAGQFGIVLKD